MNRLTLHESVAPDLATHDLVEVAAQAGFDSIGLRVAGVPGAAGRWQKGAGTAELRETVDRLLSTRVSVLDIGRAELRTDIDRDELAESHRSVLDLGVRLGAHWATACPVGPAADLAQVINLFAGFIAECEAYQLVPLLVSQPGTAVDSTARALAVVRESGGGVVVDARIALGQAEIDALLVEAGNAVGYLRLFADDLDATATPDATAGLLATVPPHVPVAISGPGLIGETDAELIEHARRWRTIVDEMLEHPHARQARLARP